MRRILSLVLAVSFVLAATAVPAFAFSDTEKSNYKTDIDQVNTLGIMTGDENGNFNPKESVTRAEFAKIISVMDSNGVELSAAGGSSSFSDLDDTHWGYKYIYYAVERGYMNGYPDKTFRPDDSITGYEALKVLITFAGYNYQAVSLGGYPTGYEYAARNLGALNGLSVDMHEYLYRDEMARLLNNILDLPYVEMVGVGKNHDYVISHEKTILNEKFSCKRGRGRVLANETASLGINKPQDEGRILIDGISMTTALNDAGDYLGYNVTYIYKFDKQDENYKELIYISPRDTKVLTLKEEDFVSYASGKLTYEKEEGVTQTANISQNADYILNNDNIAFTSDLYERLKLADITLISSTNNNTYDTIVIKEYKIVVVDVTDGMNMIVRDKYDSRLRLDLKDSIDNDVKIFLDGEEITFDKIRQKDVLTVVKGNKSTTCYVTRTTEKGVISEIDDEGNILVSDKYLERNYYSLENNKLSLNINAVIYFDIFGNVAHIETGATEGEMIAYLVKMRDNTVDMENEVFGKFFFTDETFATYLFDEDLYINGSLLKNADSQDIADRIEVDNVYQQLVKIKLSDGKIKYLTTARTRKDLESSNEDGFCLMFDKKERSFLSESMCFGFEVYVDESVPFMSVPADVDNADDRDFRVLNYKSYSNGNHTFSAYTESTEQVMPYVVLQVNAAGAGATEVFEGHDPIAVIVSKAKIITEDGEPATKLHVLKSRYGNSILEMDIFAYDADELTDGKFKISDLDVGDTIKVMYDKENRLELFKVYHKYSTGEWFGTETESVSAINRIYQRRITDVKGNYIFVESLDGAHTEIYDITKYRIIIVKNQNGNPKVLGGTAADIVTDDVGIIQTISRMPMALIIFK